MKNYSILLLLIIAIFFEANGQLAADEIIDKAIEKAGGAQFEMTTIHFTFRDKNYRSTRNQGRYSLERIFSSSDGSVHDVVSNQGLIRTIDNCTVKVADSLISRISDGVNSVHYFANLPYGLSAPAVRKELVGESVIKDESYFKIKVTFDEEGGGTDFEDEFLYWVHKTNFTVDYLAYSYAVNGGGIRFREAYNPRKIAGLRFVDYNNYKTDVLTTPLTKLDVLFESEKLTLLSKIELEDIYVYPK